MAEHPDVMRAARGAYNMLVEQLLDSEELPADLMMAAVILMLRCIQTCSKEGCEMQAADMVAAQLRDGVEMGLGSRRHVSH